MTANTGSQLHAVGLVVCVTLVDSLSQSNFTGNQCRY